MIEKRKIKVIVIKFQKARRKIRLSTEKKENYKSEIKDKIYSD